MTLKLQFSMSEDDYELLKKAEEQALDDDYLRDLIEDLDDVYTEEDLKDTEVLRKFINEALKIAYMDGFYSGITAIEKVTLPLNVTE